MITARWIGAFLFLWLFVLLAASNGYVAIRRYLLHKPAPSWLPLIGGASGVLGMLLIPYPLGKWLYFVPLALDWGCLPGFSHTLAYYLTRRGAGTQESVGSPDAEKRANVGALGAQEKVPGSGAEKKAKNDAADGEKRSE